MRGVRSFLVLLAILAGLGAYVYFVESKRDPDRDDQREKVFTVEADAIQEISLKSESGERTSLRKGDGGWQIVEPLAAAPDDAEVSGITSNLSNLEAQSVVAENPGDLAEFGLATPRVEVAFKSGGEERRLLIGRKTPTGTDLYAKTADRPRVFLISSYLEATFNRGTFDLRDKSVLKLDRDSIENITVTTPQRTLRFAKAGTDWRLTAPVEARANASAVDGLVNRIQTLQMKSTAAESPSGLAEYGLDKPAATVQLGSGSSQATLLVGKSAGDGVVYAKDASKPAVVTVDAALMDELKKEAGSFRENDLFDARAFNASHLEISSAAGTARFEKTKVKNKDGQDEERWRQTTPAPQDVDQAAFDDLLTLVTQTTATGFVDSTAKTGLDSPELTVVLKSNEGQREETVRYGRSGADAFAARAGEGGAAKISPKTMDDIKKALEALKQKPPETPAKN